MVFIHLFPDYLLMLFHPAIHVCPLSGATISQRIRLLKKRGGGKRGLYYLVRKQQWPSFLKFLQLL